MRKYTRPKLVCRTFAKESILTVSEPAGAESSMAKLKNQLTTTEGIAPGSILEAVWE